LKLQVYVLRQLVVSLAFSVGGMMLVALPGIAVRTAHEIPSAGAHHLIQFLAISLQNLVPYVLPICFLLATVSTYGRLAADKEWIAIQMAGVRPSRLLIPSLTVGAVLGVGTLMLLANVLPGGKSRQRELVIEATSDALANLGSGGTSLSFGDGKIVLEALTFDETTGLLHEVFLRNGHGAGGTDYHADAARIEIVDSVLHADLYDLFVVERTADGLNHWETAHLEVHRTLEKDKRSVRPRYLTTGGIKRGLERGIFSERKTAHYRFEIQYRRALAAVFLVFALLGPATGLLARRGTQLGAMAICSAYALLHHLLQMQVAKDLGTSGTWPPAVAAWSPIALGAVASFLVLRKALRR
jgi:lipopolysaccharide export LptBFGC system permease protein LptF